MDSTSINYLLLIIIYEKETRAKTYHTERRANDRFQHSYFIAFQQ